MKILLPILSNSIEGFAITVPILNNMSILVFHVIGFFHYFTTSASSFIFLLNVPQNSPGALLGSCGPAPKSQGHLQLHQLHVMKMANSRPINVHHYWHQLLPLLWVNFQLPVGGSEGLASVDVSNFGVMIRRRTQWIIIIKEVFGVLEPRICEQLLYHSRCIVQSLVHHSPRNRKLDLLLVGELVCKIVPLGQFSEHCLAIYVGWRLLE